MDWKGVNNDVYENRVEVKICYFYERKISSIQQGLELSRSVYIWEESWVCGNFIILSLNLRFYSINNYCSLSLDTFLYSLI